MRGVSLIAALAVLLPSAAWANGQTTHVWITLQAVDRLEPGPVFDLLGRSDMRDPLVNGAMFPDGGYAVGDGYGEMAHWEPFQQAYLAWIRDTFDPPYDAGDAAGHVAFLMGMGSHGMADEVFDSLFMERSRIYDPAWNDPEIASLDTASDVLLASQVGGVSPAESWLPAEILSGIFRDDLAYEVSAETLENGQDLLYIALGVVDALAVNTERLATFGAGYPWTTDNLLNESTPGSPLHEATVVARYWEDLWLRLHSEPSVGPVLDFVPGNQTYAHPRDATTVEARLALNFARGVQDDSLGALRVEDADGDLIPMDVGTFYGDRSHAVLLRPAEDWMEDSAYTVFVGDGLMDHDGAVFEGEWSATFHTGDAPIVEDEEPGCACASAGVGSSSWMLVLVLGMRRRR